MSDAMIEFDRALRRCIVASGYSAAACAVLFIVFLRDVLLSNLFLVAAFVLWVVAFSCLAISGYRETLPIVYPPDL